MDSKMNNSSCSTDNNEMIRNCRNSTNDSTKNQGDLRELKNQGDLREITDGGGNKKMNMINSDY